MTTEEPMLEACPFCGIELQKAPNRDTWWHTDAGACVLSGQDFEFNEIAAWNTRVSRTPPVDQDEVGKLVETLRWHGKPGHMQSDKVPIKVAMNRAADILASIGSGAGDVREALEKCRDVFAGYVEMHKAKLPSGPDATAPANWREIAEKITRNREMVELCDAALSTDTGR